MKSSQGLKTIENNEEIFLKCINDVKHELVKNPQQQISKSKGGVNLIKPSLKELNVSKTSLNNLNTTNNRPHTALNKNNDYLDEESIQKLLENEV